MKVAFDTSLYHFTQAGVTQYARTLIGALRALGECDVVELSFRPMFGRSNRSLRAVDTLRHGVLWRGMQLPRLLAKVGADVFHSPTGNSCAVGVPSIATIHDLHLWHAPGDFPLWHRISDRHYITQALRRAKVVVTDSSYVREDLLAHFPFVDQATVRVVPCGLDLDRYRFLPERGTAVCAEQAVSEPYLLAVSTLAPNKNMSRLLEAFAQVAGEMAHQLVIVGASGWKVGGLGEKVRELGLTGRVVFCGRVSDEDIVTLYGKADGFVFPSLYEGFGLPPLEAMVNGVPVLASNTTSVPEVVGEAALLVDPHSVEAIAGGMRRLVADEALRTELARRGPQRAAGFSCVNTARMMLELYRTLV